MKWLLILCHLIIFSFGVFCAETDEYDEKCIDQYSIESARIRNCSDEIYENNNSFNDVITTLLQYSGDEASIRTLANKNCPILEQLLECSVISDNLDKNCIPPSNRELNRIQYDVPKAVLNYACANNAKYLLRLLESKGFSTIFENKKFDKCYNLMDSGNRRMQLPDITDLCEGVNRLHECYVNDVQDHANKNLVPIANDLHVVIRRALKCQNVSVNLIY